jgi:dihydroorotase-like cyclic amidohydrolase
VVDGVGATLLPGLIDSHVHAMRAANLTRALAFGVTTELDMFCVPPYPRQLREVPPRVWMWPIFAAPGLA